MDDQAYVAELLAILTNEHPTGIDPADPYGMADDGIDRYDGFGRDMKVTGIRIVDGQHGDEIEVSFRLRGLRGRRRGGSVRLDFDSEWRTLSGYAEPAAYAPVVATKVELAAHSIARPVRRWERPAATRRRLPSRADQWALLHDHISEEGRTTETAPGRFEVVVEEGTDAEQTVTLVITPDEWAGILESEGPGLGDMFAETFGPLDEDERFIVVHKGRLARSTREELPPVSGRSFERRMAEFGEPGPGDGWFAYRPSE